MLMRKIIAKNMTPLRRLVKIFEGVEGHFGAWNEPKLHRLGTFIAASLGLVRGFTHGLTFTELSVSSPG